MPLRICIYEDKQYRQFFPLTHLRPVYCMRAGILPLFRRTERYFENPDLCLGARHKLAPVVSARYRDYAVNIVQRQEDQPVLFLNGRVRSFGDLARLVSETRMSTVFLNQGETVAVLFKPESIKGIPTIATPDDYLQAAQQQRGEIADFDTTATLYHYPWEIMADIESEVTADFRYLVPGVPANSEASVAEAARLVNDSEIYLGSRVEVKSGALIDASGGPVYIDSLTRVEPQAAIFGPCYIGPNSVVTAGKISGSSIGHTCRVGGEVEETVFQSYVNKYHAGFIGHSYVGSWVNFGAMTTNSDLKNNYSNIRVTLNGESIDTGSIKVGSFIGDHTKFGIGMLLNTGINIGVCCNIFGGGLVIDKEVPSFKWGNSAGYETYNFEKAMKTERAVAERRQTSLTAAEEELLQLVAGQKNTEEGCLDFWPPTGG